MCIFYLLLRLHISCQYITGEKELNERYCKTQIYGFSHYFSQKKTTIFVYCEVGVVDLMVNFLDVLMYENPEDINSIA